MRKSEKSENKILQNTTISKETGLTPQQEYACIMLAGGYSITDVAEKVGVNRSTIYQWQSNLAFVCYFNRQSKAIKDEVKNGVMGLCQQAIETVRDILTNGNETTRLKAAVWIMEKAEAIQVGCTNVRDAIRERHTHPMMCDYDEIVDEIAIQRDLERLGLSDKE